MLNRLDQVSPEKEDISLPDTSVLCAADQDRFDDLLHAAREGTLTHNELTELNLFWKRCPPLGEEPVGPSIEVPNELRFYWTWSQKASEWRGYCFHNLRMVDRERFVELCARYGWESGDQQFDIKRKMTPLDRWCPDDQIEIKALLDLAAKKSGINLVMSA